MENTLCDDGKQLSVSSNLAAVRTAKLNIHQRVTLAHKLLEVHSKLNRDIHSIVQLDEYVCRNKQDKKQHEYKIPVSDCDSSLDSIGPIIEGNFTCSKRCRRRAKHKLKRTQEFMKHDNTPNSSSRKEVSPILIKNDLTTVHNMPMVYIEERLIELAIQDDKTVESEIKEGEGELFENRYQNRSDELNTETNNLAIELFCSTQYQCDVVNEKSGTCLVEAQVDVSSTHDQLLQSDEVVAQPVQKSGRQVSKKSILKLCGSVSSADSNIIKRYPPLILADKNTKEQKVRKPERFVPESIYTANKDEKYLSQKTLLQHLNLCEQNLKYIILNNVNSIDQVSAASNHEATRNVEGAVGVEDVEGDEEHKCLELFSLVRDKNLLEELNVPTDETELLKGPKNHLFDKEVSRLLTRRDSELKTDETAFCHQEDNATQTDMQEVIEFKRDSPLLISSTTSKKFKSKETQTSARCTCGNSIDIMRTKPKRRTHRSIYLDFNKEDH